MAQTFPQLCACIGCSSWGAHCTDAGQYSRLPEPIRFFQTKYWHRGKLAGTSYCEQGKSEGAIAQNTPNNGLLELLGSWPFDKKHFEPVLGSAALKWHSLYCSFCQCR